jgi:hypothetical protein
MAPPIRLVLNLPSPAVNSFSHASYLYSLSFSRLLLNGSITDSPPGNKKPVGVNLQKAATGAFAAFTIASSVLTSAPPASDATPTFFSSSNMVAEKIIREGMYQDYEVDLVQQVDDARSTFKPAKETKTNKGEYCRGLGYTVKYYIVGQLTLRCSLYLKLLL